jgi:HSP20 family molecular chaperone IbpA
MNKNHDTNPSTSEVENTSARRVTMPRADIYEAKDGVHLVADMPGVDESSIDVTLHRNVLTISGKVPAPTLEGHRRVYAEFEEADFNRSFRLADQSDASGIHATVKNGVLRVFVPKSEPAVKRIPVRAQ